MVERKKEWYESRKAVYFMLVLFFPMGLYGLWKNESFGRPAKILATSIIGAIVIGYTFIEPLPPETRTNPQAAGPSEQGRVLIDLAGNNPPMATQTAAKPYRVFHRSDFSFPGRTRVEWWIMSPEAKTFEERGRTAMQAAIDLQKDSRAHVVSIWLEASPNIAGTGQQLATAMYAPDSGGLSGTQGWKWQIEAADTPGPTTSRKKYQAQ
jgi:cell division protein FtsW (lipid II flippase)